MADEVKVAEGTLLGEPQPTVVDVAALQAALEVAKADLVKAQEEAKLHQRMVSKKDEELQKRKGLDGKVDGIADRVEVLAQMVADLVDNRETLGDTAPKKSADYLKPLEDKARQRQETEAQRIKREYEEKAIEADDLAKTAGLDMTLSPELVDALEAFQSGNAILGLRLAKKATEGKIPKKEEVKPVADEKEQRASIEKELRVKIEKEILEKHGLLQAEGGTPGAPASGRLPTMEEIDKMPISEYRKNRDRIQAQLARAVKEGKIT